MAEQTQRVFWPFVPYLIMSVVHVVSILSRGSITYTTKLTLMPLLAIAVLVALVGAVSVRWSTAFLLLFGILASWLGDGAAWFFPMFDDDLPMMLLCFGIAHLAYMWIFWRTPDISFSSVGEGRKRSFIKPWAWGYIAVYVVLIAVIMPQAGVLAVPVMLYGLVLAGTAMLASRVSGIVALGGFWFLVSDSVLAFIIFVPGFSSPITSGIVMTTYTLGQGLIAYGLTKKLAETEEA